MEKMRHYKSGNIKWIALKLIIVSRHIKFIKQFYILHVNVLICLLK